VLAGVMLAGPRTILERRIIAMSSTTSRHPRLRAAAAAFALFVLGLGACESTTPMAPQSAAPQSVEQELPSKTEIVALQESLATPLYVVDGVVLGRMANPGSVIQRLEAKRIESVEVLKGVAATGRFGADAAEGAIVITTRGDRSADDSAAPARVAIGRLTPKTTIAATRSDEAKQVQGVAVASVGHRAKTTMIAVAPTSSPKLIGIVQAAPSKTVAEVRPKPLVSSKNAVPTQAVGIAKLDAVIAGTTVTAKQLLQTADNTAVSPLIIIDGREASSADLSKLGKDEIDRIEVLKGTAARTAYGERGMNGVVRITTRR
jgi:TonB-dependent SusC/RagA subfamily outer membrane receptor